MLAAQLHNGVKVKESALRSPATGEDYSHIFKVQMVLMFEWAEKLDEFRQITDAHDKVQSLLSLFVA